MNTEIKKYADSGDIKSLKYIFVDSLDVDPTFVRYEEEYNYCKSIPGLLEPHIELTPFRENQADWNEAYWTSLKMDLIKNFSDKRMSHMRDVAQVFLADKVQRILAERAVGNAIQQNIAPKAPKVAEKAAPSVSNAELQARQLEEERRKLDAEYKAAQERETKKWEDREAQKRSMCASQKESNVSKKAIGIAIAAVAVAVILILLLRRCNPVY